MSEIAAAPATVAELLAGRADDDGDGIRCGNDRWTWREVVERSAAVADWLGEQRRPGPFHVGLLLDNTPTYLFGLFGAALAGAAVVGINSTRRGEELARDIRHTDCQLVVTDPGYAELLDGLDLGDTRIVVLDDGRWPSAVGAGTAHCFARRRSLGPWHGIWPADRG